jgi:phosphate:Na+ symporter
VLLAIFHTLTKLMGVAIMWPLTNWMVGQLERRFRSMEEDESTPNHLDRNVQRAPALALDAMTLELRRMYGMARTLAADSLSSERPRLERLEQGHRALESLSIAVADFASGIDRHDHDRLLSSTLPIAARVSQYLVDVGEQALEFARLQHEILLDDPALAEEYQQLRARAIRLLDRCELAPEAGAPDDESVRAEREEFERAYQALKSHLLRGGTAGSITPRRMAAALEQASALHRLIDQAVKAALYLGTFIRACHDGAPESTDSDNSGSSAPAAASNETQDAA